MKQLIKNLTETFSPSGYEGTIRESILADEIRRNAMMDYGDIENAVELPAAMLNAPIELG